MVRSVKGVGFLALCPLSTIPTVSDSAFGSDATGESSRPVSVAKAAVSAAERGDVGAEYGSTTDDASAASASTPASWDGAQPPPNDVTEATAEYPARCSGASAWNSAELCLSSLAAGALALAAGAQPGLSSVASSTTHLNGNRRGFGGSMVAVARAQPRVTAPPLDAGRFGRRFGFGFGNNALYARPVA